MPRFRLFCVFAAALVAVVVGGAAAQSRTKRNVNNGNQAATGNTAPRSSNTAVPQTSNGLSNGGSSGRNAPTALILLGLGVLSMLTLGGWWQWRRRTRRQHAQRWHKLLAQYNTAAFFYCGSYTGGLFPGLPAPAHAYCLVVGEHLVFVTQNARAVIGRVQRRRVLHLAMFNRSVTITKADPLAILLLGVFGLLFRWRETREGYVVQFQWEDERSRVRHTASFEFDGRGSYGRATGFANDLQQYVLISS